MLKTFSITDIGKKRTMNQDFVFSSENPVGGLPNLFIVADGMGGHNGGGYASSYAVEVIREFIENSDLTGPEALFKSAIEEANTKVRIKAAENPELSGMGTTVVMACLFDDTLYVANVGDSRLYVIDSDIRQITTDHSYVEEMIKVGQLDRESARTHSQKNIITRAVGAEDTVVSDFFSVALHPGDTVLMCSDGLTNMLEDRDISLILKSGRDVVGKAEELVKAANANGGKDNIAVILIEPFSGQN